MNSPRRILVLYAGGTIGMVQQDGAYLPGDALPAYLQQWVLTHPVLSRHQWEVRSLAPLLDSANAQPADWYAMAASLWAVSDTHHAAVILHGTDTMDYGCAFLSFFMQGWKRPVVFTGAQIPLGVAGSDANKNLEDAMLCALQGPPEVMLCMGGRVMRGTRVIKQGVDPLSGFQSPHYPELAFAGEGGLSWAGRAAKLTASYEETGLPGHGQAVGLRPQEDRASTAIQGHIAPKAVLLGGDAGARTPEVAKLAVMQAVRIEAPKPSVGVLRLYPGMPAEILPWLGKHHPQGLVLQSYGSGTGPTASHEFRQGLLALRDSKVPVLAVSQCAQASADLFQYEAGRLLLEVGVAPGADMTSAAAFAKLHWLAALRSLAQQGCEPARALTPSSAQAVQAWLQTPLVGELSHPSSGHD